MSTVVVAAKLKRSDAVCGNVANATTSTVAVLSFRLSGSEPSYVTVPQIPEQPVVGCSPPLQERAAVHSAVRHRRLRMDAIIGAPGPSVNLTAV